MTALVTVMHTLTNFQQRGRFRQTQKNLQINIICDGCTALDWLITPHYHSHEIKNEKIMKKTLLLITAVFALGVAQLAYAGQDEFCTGFTEGYKSIKGDMVLVPLCPLAPLTPLGSTDFREGIKAGIRAAQS